MTGTEIRLHQSVMLPQILDVLAIQPDGCYVDGTFGRGGHTAGLLARLGTLGRVIAFDRDPEAIGSRPDLCADPRLELIHQRFSTATDLLEARGLHGHVHGVLLDLGISSPQIDEPSRGFSFRRDGPLDMRMDPSQGQSAAEWLMTASEAEIRDCLWNYGDERKSRQIAARICLLRQTQPIETTRQLAEIVAGIVRGERRIDPATRTFQALRILINNELDELRTGLAKLVDFLGIAGRIAVISFHSLEDRIVKRYFRDLAREVWAPTPTPDAKKYRLVFRKSVVPDEAEIERNPRARSARLRVLERIA